MIRSHRVRVRVQCRVGGRVRVRVRSSFMIRGPVSGVRVRGLGKG